MLEFVSVSVPARIIDWYLTSARDLPWRHEEVSAWGILVSEFMLQQTQVDRVLPQWIAWMTRWPIPEDLAHASAHEVIVAWGRLGYPRRALWLHEAAKRIVNEFDGEVPATVEELLTLKGVGDYTARAVAVFAHRQRHAVLDTNVRRVLARVYDGQAEAAPPRWTKDLAKAEKPLPEDPEQARIFSYGIMEFGAVICTARAPKCDACPLRDVCAWALADFPPYEGKKISTQSRFEGSLRQTRGQILALFRDQPSRNFTAEEVQEALMDLHPSSTRERITLALASLTEDGLLEVSEPAPDPSQSQLQQAVSCYRLPR